MLINLQITTKNEISFCCSGLHAPLSMRTAIEIKINYLNCGSIQTNDKNETATKICVDKGIKFEKSFKNSCQKKGVQTYITISEQKTASAERNDRSLMSLVYKCLESSN